MANDWYERQYDTHPESSRAAAVLATWPERSAATRKRWPLTADQAYGPHPRELLDVFRAPGAAGCVYYIHGGYWRRRTKEETSWVADAFLQAGVSVALLNYPLCPGVSMTALCASALRGFAHLYSQLLTPEERARIVVIGHSAGGHLAALHMSADWTGFGLPAAPLAGVIGISGLYDLTPLTATSVNDDARMDAAEARRLSPAQFPVRAPAPLLLAAGGDESPEFHRQTRMLARAWAAPGVRSEIISGCDHFEIVDGLRPGGGLAMAALEMLGAGRAG